MKATKSISLFLAGFLVIATGLLCGGCVAQPAASQPADSVDSRLVEANTKFAFDLFREILDEKPSQNIFVSPASVSMALAMTYNGAGGETRQAMAKTLGLEGLDLAEVNQANADLKSILENPDPGVKLTTANSLWTRKGFAFRPEFLQRNKDYYGAEVKELDFSSPGAPEAINSWVKKQTDGKIDQIVKNINQDSVLFLINAIYFKGGWTKKFEREKTREGIFNLPDGSQKKHPMMSQSGRYMYYKGNSFQAVRLPYGRERVSMYVFLPDEGSGNEKFINSLNAVNWEEWLSRFRETQGRIVMPRFKYEDNLLLNDALKALGMGIIFDSQRADFSNMLPAPPNLFVDYVRHKTFIEVNEEGTEAAAATAVGVKASGHQESFNMVVDRPFFFAIRDDKTGIVLFMGYVTEPN